MADTASQPLSRTRKAHLPRTADTEKAAELAQKFPGWSVFSSRDKQLRMATRAGNPTPPAADDGIWARSLLADTWIDLEKQLSEQAKADAARG